MLGLCYSAQVVIIEPTFLLLFISMMWSLVLLLFSCKTALYHLIFSHVGEIIIIIHPSGMFAFYIAMQVWHYFEIYVMNSR